MNQELRRKLDRITDVLWGGGVTNPITYIEQLSYLIYMKLLDEREAEVQRARSMGVSNDGNVSLYLSQAERYRWSSWRFLGGTELLNFLGGEVFPYMSSLVREQPQVAEYFRDATLEIRDAHILKQVVDEIDTIVFSRLGPDVKGDIFEYLLTHIDQAGLNGQFRTPRQIRTMMVEMTAPDFGDTICDPACGTGGFLIDAVEYVLGRYTDFPEEVPIYGEEWLEKRGQTIEEAKAAVPTLQTWRKGPGEKIPNWEVLERSVHGFDVSRAMMRISMMNLVLHGIPNANVKRANTLSEMGGLTEDDLRREYDVILSNPPFAGVLPRDSIRRDLPTNSKKSEILFLSLMLESLAPGGRCAVVVPEGLLFGGTGAHIDLRRKLIEQFELLAVVSLPAGVFRPYTGVKTAVLVFRRPVAADRKTERVWFYDVRADGYDPDRVVAGGRPETPERNDIPDLLRRWQEYRQSGFSTPPGVKAREVLESDSAEPRSWWATANEVSESEFNIAVGTWRPQPMDESVFEPPEQIIRSIITLEDEISTSLRKLLIEVSR